MNEITPVNNMALVIPLKMKNILDHLAKKPLEWTAFGEIEEVQNEDGMYFILNDISFPKQENSSSATDVTDDEYAEFGELLHKAKKDTSKYKIWIHSHNTMKAFWSGTDTSQMESFSTPNTTHRLSLVVSSTDEWKACFNLHKPIRIDFDIPIVINDCVTEQKVLDKYKKDLESKEKERTYITKATHKGGAVAWNSSPSMGYDTSYPYEELAVFDVAFIPEDTIEDFNEIFWKLEHGDKKKKLSKTDKIKYKHYKQVTSYLDQYDLDFYKDCIDYYKMTPEIALEEVADRKNGYRLGGSHEVPSTY